MAMLPLLCNLALVCGTDQQEVPALFSAIPLLGPGWILPEVSLDIQSHKTLSKCTYMKDAFCLTRDCFQKASTSGSNHSRSHSSWAAWFPLVASTNLPGTAWGWS